jgi:hypothetical protein
MFCFVGSTLNPLKNLHLGRQQQSEINIWYINAKGVESIQVALRREGNTRPTNATVSRGSSTRWRNVKSRTDQNGCLDWRAARIVRRVLRHSRFAASYFSGGKPDWIAVRPTLQRGCQRFFLGEDPCRGRKEAGLVSTKLPNGQLAGDAPRNDIVSGGWSCYRNH